MPLTLSLPTIDIINSASVDPKPDEGGETYANLAQGYTIRELEQPSGKVIQERSGTNFAVPWDWYVDKRGRNSILLF